MPLIRIDSRPYTAIFCPRCRDLVRMDVEVNRHNDPEAKLAADLICDYCRQVVATIQSQTRE